MKSSGFWTPTRIRALRWIGVLLVVLLFIGVVMEGLNRPLWPGTWRIMGWNRIYVSPPADVVKQFIPRPDPSLVSAWEKRAKDAEAELQLERTRISSINDADKVRIKDLTDRLETQSKRVGALESQLAAAKKQQTSPVSSQRRVISSIQNQRAVLTRVPLANAQPPK